MNINKIPDISKTGLGNSQERMTYEFIDIDRSVYPEAQVRQRLAKMRNWQVCKSWLDAKRKLFVYEVAVNADEIDRKCITFADACKDLHWKKFDIINNGQTLKWHRDSAWDKEVAAAELKLAEWYKTSAHVKKSASKFEWRGCKSSAY